MRSEARWEVNRDFHKGLIAIRTPLHLAGCLMFIFDFNNVFDDINKSKPSQGGIPEEDP